MYHLLETNGTKDKLRAYEQFLTEYSALIDGEHDEISVMANTTAALKETFNFFWVGFYIVKDNKRLALGPFQGNTACFNIRKGHGVCGTAWEEGKTIVVPNVDLFPGHIACSAKTRSEIVVPVIHENKVRAVLDIDSENLAAFDETDRIGLEKMTNIMVRSLYMQ